MFYADLKTKPEPAFKRLTGVRPATFLEMCEALEKYLSSRGGKPKHCLQDRLLLTLMYWREYRTHTHIGQTYGLSESAVCRTIDTVEEALMRSGQFTLPGKKALTRSNLSFEVVVIDATECPVERPKKTAAQLQRQEEASYHPNKAHKKPKSSPIRRQNVSKFFPKINQTFSFLIKNI